MRDRTSIEALLQGALKGGDCECGDRQAEEDAMVHRCQTDLKTTAGYVLCAQLANDFGGVFNVQWTLDKMVLSMLLSAGQARVVSRTRATTHKLCGSGPRVRLQGLAWC